jgi:hypothetical protein
MRASIVIVSLALIGLAGVAALDGGLVPNWAELTRQIIPAGWVAAAAVAAAVLLYARAAAGRRRRRTPHTWPSGGGTLIDHGR